ncbi:hypothetical protein BT96DRAFT_996327 [Gymnopus androsaceus JB14]|uniref:Uncharacterized protein n=1 Tax=Gymnopus androsaceus JB14 TaxID=1447944 RepID=A0A6A4HJ81_9AGAR|nr:hypothetical protein BT96DRAFT_996327 [Gymnopus androsaceus JB14]
MIMKVHSYMTINGYLQPISQQSQAILKELRAATETEGGWEHSISVANGSSFTVESSQARTSGGSSPIGTYTPPVIDGAKPLCTLKPIRQVLEGLRGSIREDARRKNFGWLFYNCYHGIDYSSTTVSATSTTSSATSSSSSLDTSTAGSSAPIAGTTYGRASKPDGCQKTTERAARDPEEGCWVVWDWIFRVCTWHLHVSQQAGFAELERSTSTKLLPNSLFDINTNLNSKRVDSSHPGPFSPTPSTFPASLPSTSP